MIWHTKSYSLNIFFQNCSSEIQSNFSIADMLYSVDLVINRRCYLELTKSLWNLHKSGHWLPKKTKKYLKQTFTSRYFFWQWVKRVNSFWVDIIFGSFRCFYQIWSPYKEKVNKYLLYSKKTNAIQPKESSFVKSL